VTTVSIIGTGNVGYHVHKMIAKLSDYEVVSICGTSIEKAKSIKAGKTASYIDNLNQVPKSDIVLLCVPDTKIKSIAKKLSKLSQLDRSVVAHTSGSVSSSHLSSCKKYGVFYPLQTFTKGQRMSYNIIPFCIHGNTSAVVKKLTVLASLISKDVRKVDDKARKEIHLSAVLVNNMVNHIIHLSQKRLSDQKIAADILLDKLLEQIYKFRDGTGINNTADVTALLDEAFMQKVAITFLQMGQTYFEALEARTEDEDLKFEII